MKALATRLKNLALRPLWTETAVHRARRRIQLLLSMPFVLMGGMTWGWFASPDIAEGSRLLWSVLGASGFGIFFYIEQRLPPPSWQHWPTASGWVAWPPWRGK